MLMWTINKTQVMGLRLILDGTDGIMKYIYIYIFHDGLHHNYRRQIVYIKKSVLQSVILVKKLLNQENYLKI